jgi:RNA polymerase sigma factor (sigma-70 family)
MDETLSARQNGHGRPFAAGVGVAIEQLREASMDSWSEVGDAELVKRSRAGERDAWTALTRRHSNRLWSVARALRLSDTDAADAVQTTWLRLVEHLDDLREPEYVGTWLATTIRRECLDALKRRTRLVLTDRWDDVVDREEPLDSHLLRDERDGALWRAFRALDERCRTLLRVLMADPPPPYAEVSAALDIPVGSIGPTRQRCLAKLRTIMRAEPYPFETPPEPA